jgi:16S rRNA (guanine1207-N2)-methyltransferase
MARRRADEPEFPELPAAVRERLRPPLAVVLGSPGEVVRILPALAVPDAVCYQMDLHPAERLRHELEERNLPARVVTAADLWDLPADFQTVLYPAPRGGERALKIDMIEQAFHLLRPHGCFVVWSPYEADEFFPGRLKKVFGKIHAPPAGGGTVFWCVRDGDRPRRRHEMTFQARVGDFPSRRFLSRPGVFSYGRFDNGSRALLECATVNAGDRVLDLGCGCGTNGVFAAQRGGPEGSTTFLDSNLRAVALAEHNARANGLGQFRTVAALVGTAAPGTFDLVLANPPYFAQSAIAGQFVEHGRRVLRDGGRFYLVTKQVAQVGQMVADTFGEVEGVERRGYVVFSAVAGG